MRRWWIAYGVCASILLLGLAASLLGRDQFAAIDEQRQALLERGQAVTATLTYVESGAVAYEYRFAGTKHYGSASPAPSSAGLAVGQQIEIRVSPDDPDVSAYHPERATARGSRVHLAGPWLEFAGLAGLFATASLQLLRRRR